MDTACANVTDGSSCFDLRGVCFNQTCACQYPYQQHGDGTRFSECSVNLNVSFGLYVLNALLWASAVCSTLIAYWLSSRNLLVNPTDTQRLARTNERFLLRICFLVSVLNISAGVAILSPPFGTRFIGINLDVTILGALAASGSWYIILSKPLHNVNWSGKSLSTSNAFVLTPSTLTVYSKFFPVLYLLAVAAQLLTVGILVGTMEEAVLCLQSMLLLSFLMVFIMAKLVFAAFYLFRKKMLQTIPSTPDAVTRKNLQQFLVRSTRKGVGLLLVLEVMAMVFIGLGIVPTLARQWIWIVFPLAYIGGGLSMLYVTGNSIRTSVRVVFQLMKAYSEEEEEEEVTQRELSQEHQRQLQQQAFQPEASGTRSASDLEPRRSPQKKRSKFQKNRSRAVKILSVLSEHSNEGSYAGSAKSRFSGRQFSLMSTATINNRLLGEEVVLPPKVNTNNVNME